MAIDLSMFADKLQRYCHQFAVSFEMLSEATGISLDRLTALSEQRIEPTGDEILILADYFKCDYKFFISNERLAPFEQTENLFRKHGGILTSQDRWAIQEFLFLCECQQYLLTQLNKTQVPFKFVKKGTNYKEHGKEAALSLRHYLHYQDNMVPRNIYEDFRRIGIHVFRRQLGQSAISGLFIRHPTAGLCVLVNYNEDVFRQRFTVAHESAHAILDDENDFVVSFVKWDRNDLSEIRANTFASHFLMPPAFLKSIPSSSIWNREKVLEWSKKLLVNTEALVYALYDAKLITKQQVESLKQVKISRHEKVDPELPDSLTPRSRERKRELLKHGLSGPYVNLCFDAYDQGIITAGRLAEMLLCDERELLAISELHGRKLIYDG